MLTKMIIHHIHEYLCEHDMMRLKLISKKHFWVKCRLSKCKPCSILHHVKSYAMSAKLCNKSRESNKSKTKSSISSINPIFSARVFYINRTSLIFAPVNLPGVITMRVLTLSSCDDILILVKQKVNFFFEVETIIQHYERFGMTFIRLCEHYDVPLLWDSIASYAMRQCKMDLVTHVSMIRPNLFVEQCSLEKYIRPQIEETLKKTLRIL